MARDRKIIQKYKQAHLICEKCKQQQTSVIHHIVPVVYGGEDDEENLLAVCDDCHKYLHKQNHGELTAQGIKNPKNKSTGKYAWKIRLLEFIDANLDDYRPTTAIDIIDMIIAF